MKKEEIINSTVQYVKNELEKAEGGHDWWHIQRVWKNAVKIAEKEGGDLLIVELGALLHDIADYKFHDGNEEIGPQKARTFLNNIQVDESVIKQVEYIIRHISFKGGNQMNGHSSLELKIVQDADRLDALGAVGIARTFNYGGFKNRSLYDPAIPPKMDMTKEEYKQSDAPTLNHFYEKLFRLKDLMNTCTGRQLAEERHNYMEDFVARFKSEFEGI